MLKMLFAMRVGASGARAYAAGFDRLSAAGAES
jgi:hypothetical protein